MTTLKSLMIAGALLVGAGPSYANELPDVSSWWPSAAAAPDPAASMLKPLVITEHDTTEFT